MATQKIVSSNNYHLQGTSYAKYAAGTGVSINRLNTNGVIVAGTGDLNFFNGPVDNAQPSWGVSQSVDSTGSMLFMNTLNGGSLDSVILANRGGSNVYIGFNSTSPTIGTGFLLASGESLQHDALITSIWAIAGTGLSTTVAGQGSYSYDRKNFIG